MAFAVLVEVFNTKIKTKIMYFDLELSFLWFKEAPFIYFNTVIIYKSFPLWYWIKWWG